MRVFRFLTWKFDMATYRLFQWRWAKRFKRNPELYELFVEWIRRRQEVQPPIAMEAKIRVNTFLDKHSIGIEWAKPEAGKRST